MLQVTGEPVGEVRAVSDMHQRKAEMARQADAFIALPGKDLICRMFYGSWIDKRIRMSKTEVVMN